MIKAKKIKVKKIERGFYKPKSYRLSDDNHEWLKTLGREFGSQNKAINYLKEIYEKHKLASKNTRDCRKT